MAGEAGAIQGRRMREEAPPVTFEYVDSLPSERYPSTVHGFLHVKKSFNCRNSFDYLRLEEDSFTAQLLHSNFFFLYRTSEMALQFC